jgi:hypothetical protein
MRAIYADGQPVAFVLTFEEPSEGHFLWRFMIAGATRLYESLGLRLTGEQDDGELVMTLEL